MTPQVSRVAPTLLASDFVMVENETHILGSNPFQTPSTFSTFGLSSRSVPNAPPRQNSSRNVLVSNTPNRTYVTFPEITIPPPSRTPSVAVTQNIPPMTQPSSVPVTQRIGALASHVHFKPNLPLWTDFLQLSMVA